MIILTEHTNDNKVLAGNCFRCGAYNEVWRNQMSTKCHNCENSMFHIHQRWFSLALLVGVITLIIITI